MRRGLRLAAGHFETALQGPALAYATHRRQAMAFLNQGPRTLVHHDCHPGNLYWHDSQPGLLDRQLLRIGEGIGDIAYLLATALEPEVRRRHELNLLKHYRECLAREAIDPPRAQDLLQRYRAPRDGFTACLVRQCHTLASDCKNMPSQQRIHEQSFRRLPG